MDGRRLVNTFGVPEIICTGRCLCYWEGWVWASWAEGDGSSYWVKVCTPTPVESPRAAVQRCSRMTDAELHDLIGRTSAFERDLRQVGGFQRFEQQLRAARELIRKADADLSADMRPSQRPRTAETVEPSYAGVGDTAAWLASTAAESEMPRDSSGPGGGAEEGAHLILPPRGGSDGERRAPFTPTEPPPAGDMHLDAE